MTTEITAPEGEITAPRPTVSWTADLIYFPNPVLATFNQQRLYILPASAFLFGLGDTAVDEATFQGANGTFGQSVLTHPTNAWLPCTATSGSVSIPNTLAVPFGQLKAVILLRDTFRLAYYWIVGPTFYRTDPPNTPTNVTPAAAATVDTNLPTLGLTLVASAGGTPVRGEWQLATDSGFTANVRTVTEPAVDLRTSGITSEVVPSAAKLFAGTWHIRGRAKNGGDETSAWTAGHSFTVAHLPGTVAHSPTGGVVLPYGDGFITFGWQFTSSSPDLEQSAYRVIIETADGETEVLDTTKETSTDQIVVLEVEDTYVGEPLRWKVKVWDDEDVEGDYSDWHLFRLIEPGTVAVTSPTENEVLEAALEVEWTHTPSASGAVQAAYRVVVREDTVDETVVYDSGLVYSDATTLEVDASTLENETAYTVEVVVRDTLDLESSAVQPFSVDWDAPDQVPFSVEASTFDTAGPVTVLIDTTDVLDEAFAFLRVRRRLPGGEWETVGDFTEAGPFVRVADYRGYPSRTLEYDVLQYAFRFGALVASDAPDPVEITLPPSGSFWLIADENRAVEGDTAPAVALLAADESLRIEFASDDPHADELERAEVLLRGRGRKVETGTRWGRRGSLTFSLIDNETMSAYEQQQRLEGFQTVTPVLRKPNGEVLTVSLTVQFAPQGRDDFVQVQAAYAEVI